jgi:phosphonate transport system substrate-binding protein
MRQRMRLRMLAIVGAAAMATAGLSACGDSAADNTETLVISGVPAEEGTDLSNTYTPLIKMLEKELDMKVEFKPSTSYASVIEGQRSGKIQIAQYGALAYYQALQSGSEVSALGAMIKEKGKDPGYLAYGIVPGDSKIDSIEDFAGKKLCFVDKSSTSGYLYPLQGLLEAGVETGDWEEVFAGGHDASALAVAEGDCDAGFALDSMVDTTLVDKGDLKDGDLKVVWKSDTIAEPPITISDEVDKDLKAKLMDIFKDKANQDYLVKNGFCEEGECALTDQRIWGWQPVAEDYYDSLVEVCEFTKAEACNDAG